jgi:hypothetical protein
MNTSRFKFPRRVRIHGGECGAVARALHHAAKNFSLPAVKEKVFFTTNERKQMSTKTTLKRIALVAVSALGFGLTSSVAPVNATLPSTKEYVKSVSYGDIQQDSRSTIARVGISTSVGVRLSTGSSLSAAVAIGSVLTVQTYVKFSQVPSDETVLGSGSNISPTLTATAVASLDNGDLFTAGGAGGTAGVTNAVVTATSVTSPSSILLTAASTSVVLEGSKSNVVIGTATFTPNKVGTYKLFSWSEDSTSGNTAGTYDASERSATKTITVGGAPTTIVVSRLNGTTGAVGATYTAGSGGYNNKGPVFQVSVKDAAGNLTSLIPGEALSVTTTDGTLSDASLTAADFNENGYAYVNITDDADSTGTLTVAASGFTATSVANSFSAELADVYAASVGFHQTTGVTTASSGLTALTTSNPNITFAAGKAVTMRVNTAALSTDTTAGILVIDNDGDVSGDPAIYSGESGTYETPNYSLAVAIESDDDYGTVTLPTAGLVAGDSITVYIIKSATDSISMTLTAAAVAISSTSTISPSSASIVTGGAVELTAQCLDQFSQPLGGCAVSWNVTALTRNATATPTQKLADANGYSTYLLTDTSTSTTVLSSTVTATMTYAGSSNTETATITFGAGNAVNAIAVTTSPTKTVATTESEISTSATGPEAGAVTLAFTVTDANGVALAGVPVTFTADSTNVSWKSSYLDTANRQLAYTNTTGVATTYIAGWVAPSTVTVTATAGTKSVTTKVNFVPTAAAARTIAVTTGNGIVKATVKDRFGNPSKGVTVNWSRVGTGYFGSGVSATTGTTDVNGEAEILFIGDGTVKAELAVATYAQCDDASGYVGTTATSGTGASLAPAGICSATVAVTGSKDSATKAADAATTAAEAATDAAAEAIDAANAATDAANLAAEAADAATVAAEEARDAADAATAAVEELATQVATLMAALKAQITTLANTVAKIAKKVKA